MPYGRRSRFWPARRRLSSARSASPGRKRHGFATTLPFNKAEVDEIEAVTNHDVIAFLTNMGSYIDADVPEGQPKPSRWVHYGMTSSDLGDTALCYQLTQACDILIEDVRRCGEICKRRAFEERKHPVRGPHPLHPCRAHDVWHEVRQLGVGAQASL